MKMMITNRNWNLGVTGLLDSWNDLEGKHLYIIYIYHELETVPTRFCSRKGGDYTTRYNVCQSRGFYERKRDDLYVDAYDLSDVSF